MYNVDNVYYTLQLMEVLLIRNNSFGKNNNANGKG